MADVPDEIVLRRDRDLVGRRGDIWVRRAFVGAFAAISVLALAESASHFRPLGTADARPALCLPASQARLRQWKIGGARLGRAGATSRAVASAV